MGLGKWEKTGLEKFAFRIKQKQQKTQKLNDLLADSL